MQSGNPVVFSLSGQNSQLSFGNVTTSKTFPTQPIVVTPTPTPVTPALALPSQWNPPDIRKDKPVWVLIVAGALLLLVGATLIAVGVMKNKQVMRVYADVKNVTDEQDKELLADDDTLTPEYSPFRATGLIVAGSLVIAVVIGLVVGALFLPGYPLSKYMSYAKC
jgi:hypothetical protein